MPANIFGVTLDTKVSETNADTGFDTKPLLEALGPDITWRDVFKTDDSILLRIKGYGRETLNRIHSFISNNIEYSFSDLIN